MNARCQAATKRELTCAGRTDAVGELRTGSRPLIISAVVQMKPEIDLEQQSITVVEVIAYLVTALVIFTLNILLDASSVFPCPFASSR